MLNLSPSSSIYLSIEPIDFRCGIDKLASISEKLFLSDPKSGCYFVFRNRSFTALKILVYDGRGFWLCHRRLSQGQFKYWPKNGRIGSFASEELYILIQGGDPRGVCAPVWKKVTGSLEVRREEKETGRPNG